jgi:hypothetical protein
MIFIKFYILRPCKILFNCVLFLEYCTTEIMLYRGINTYFRKEFVAWRPAFLFVLRCYKRAGGVGIQDLKI